MDSQPKPEQRGATTTTRRLLQLFSWLSTAAGVLAAVFLIVAIGLILADLLSRNVAGRSLAGVTERTSWLMAGMGWLALSYTLKLDGHIDVRVLTDRLPPRVQGVLSVVVDVVALGFMAYLVNAMVDRWGYFWNTGAAGVETRTPLWWIYSVVVVGAVLFGLQLIVRLADDIARLRQGGSATET